MNRLGNRAVTPRFWKRIGAFVRSGILAFLLCVVGLSRVSAQVTPPDSTGLPADSAQLLLDSLRADSLGLDSLAVVAVPDSVSADTIFYNLPDFSDGIPEGWESGVWDWDLSEIHASTASTLPELIGEVPGLIVLLGGDYGSPASVTAFGAGGGGYRVFRDGFEVYALKGGVVDLARIGLAGIRRVRVERGLAEVRIEMWSHEYLEGRPYSLVEAGTGDLATNMFRGTYADPTAIGGSVALGLERLDTRGPGGDESGGRTASWVRYQLHRGDDAGLAMELRRVGTDSDLDIFPSSQTRTDWTIRGRARLAEGVVGEAYTGKSSHLVRDERDVYEREGGSRTQRGVRLGLERSGAWARGEYRSFGGDDVLTSRLDAQGGFHRAGVGGFAADLSKASWAGESTAANRIRAWTEPIGGVLSLFASRESGTFGFRTLPLLDVEPAVDSTAVPAEGETAEPFDPGRLFGVTDRTGTRYGATVSLLGASVSAARLEVQADSFAPIGLAPNTNGLFLEGATRKGWEAWASLPTPMTGLRLQGSLQQWEEPGAYVPEQIYRGSFDFHRVYKGGNLEWWWTLGVRGHDPMMLPILGEEDAEGFVPLESVPFYQNWYARMQLRIVTVQIFIAWDNFSRRTELQHYPGRVLPITRTMYGIRWTMFN